MPEPIADEKLAEAQNAREEMYAKFVALRTEAEQLSRQVEAVRALHEREESSGACYGCYSTWPGYVEEFPKWPCATLRALDGEKGS